MMTSEIDQPVNQEVDQAVDQTVAQEVPVPQEAPVETPPETEVTIEKIVYGGDGLARTPDGVVLVRGALPGERVSVTLEPARQGVRRAKLIRVSTPSPERITAPCPYFGRCGGCQHQQISYDQQLLLKEQVLRECFERIGKFQPEVPIIPVSAEPWEYRNRIRLQVRKWEGALRIGYAEAASHEVCAVESCPVSAPQLQQVIGELQRNEALMTLWPDGAAELELFTDEAGKSMWASVESPQHAPRAFGSSWLEHLPAFASVCWRQTSSGRQKIWGTGSIHYSVGEFRYRVSHHSFFQSNRFLLPRMLDIALADLEGDRALDLFSGVGFFTLPLASRFQQVAAVESHPPAARDLAANIGALKSRVFVNLKPANQFLKSTSPKWDLVLADPPRHGLSPSVREGIVRLRPKHLVYVSCDPTTLARDLAVLSAGSYAIRSIHLIDQFPQTYHMETIVRLESTG